MVNQAVECCKDHPHGVCLWHFGQEHVHKWPVGGHSIRLSTLPVLCRKEQIVVQPPPPRPVSWPVSWYHLQAPGTMLEDNNPLVHGVYEYYSLEEYLSTCTKPWSEARWTLEDVTEKCWPPSFQLQSWTWNLSYGFKISFERIKIILKNVHAAESLTWCTLTAQNHFSLR